MLTPLQILNGLQTVDLLHVLVTHISPADIFRQIWSYEVNKTASDRTQKNFQVCWKGYHRSTFSFGTMYT